MQLIVGLGNIGEKYKKTRHNFGFLLADKLHENYNFGQWQAKFDGEISKGVIADFECLILKPHTFMNLSGQAIIKAMAFYKIKPQQIIVLHDDIDIELGRIKYKIAGGNGGHNGLKSIDKMIGKNYQRLRLGVGRSKNENIDSASHVLGNFSNEELREVDKINQKISSDFQLLLDGDANEFLNKFYIS